MHLLTLAESYRENIDEFIKKIENKFYPATNPIDGKPTNYNVAVREVRLFDITFPDVIEDQVLTDIGYRKKHKVTMLDWILKIFKPLGWKKPKRVEKKGNFRGHFFILAKKEDKKEESGYECV